MRHVCWAVVVGRDAVGSWVSNAQVALAAKFHAKSFATDHVVDDFKGTVAFGTEAGGAAIDIHNVPRGTSDPNVP